MNVRQEVILFTTSQRGKLRLRASSNPRLSALTTAILLQGLAACQDPQALNSRSLLETWGELGPGERWEGGPRAVRAFPPATKPL